MDITKLKSAYVKDLHAKNVVGGYTTAGVPVPLTL